MPTEQYQPAQQRTFEKTRRITILIPSTPPDPDYPQERTTTSIVYTSRVPTCGVSAVHLIREGEHHTKATLGTRPCCVTAAYPLKGVAFNSEEACKQKRAHSVLISNHRVTGMCQPTTTWILPISSPIKQLSTCPPHKTLAEDLYLPNDMD